MFQIRRVDIEGIPKGAVLAALYNRSSYFGGGRGGRLNPIRGEEVFRRVGPSFDRLNGCLLRIDLSSSRSTAAGTTTSSRVETLVGNRMAAEPSRRQRQLRSQEGGMTEGGESVVD